MSKQREALKLALEAINSLWNIIDDIDTASDIAKFDDRLYRNQVEALQARRWKLDISTDGQVLTGKIIAAIREALAEREVILDDRASNQACHVAWKQCTATIDKFDGDPHGAFTMGFHAGIRAAINAAHPPAKPAAYFDMSNDLAFSMRELSNEDAYDTDAMVPLYLSPQNRKPLTDEAIHQLFKHLPSENRDGWVVAFARAIERAHGIGEP